MIGGALGLAILASVVSQRASDLIGTRVTAIAAQAGGLQLAFLVAAGIALTAALIATIALERDKPDTLTGPATSP